MRLSTTLRSTTAAILLTVASATLVHADTARSMSELEFGENGTLFIGDSLGAQILAVETGDTGAPQSPSSPILVEAIDVELARLLDAEPREIHVQDIKANPLSQNVYLAVHVGRSANPRAALVRLVKDTGEFEVLDLVGLPVTSVALPSAPGFDDTLQYGQSERTLTVTDLTWYDGGDDDPTTGEIFVAGVSNEEFASTLRRVAYPFGTGEDPVKVSSVEIYHAAHRQQETRAPIVTSVIHEIDGEPYLIAAYTCTPVAHFPLADLVDGAHVIGTTVAELGFGNAPVDMFVYENPEPLQFLGEGERLLITNDQRSAVSVSIGSIADAEPLTAELGRLTRATGLDQFPLPLTASLQTAPLNPMFTLTLRRNVQTGELNLQSVMTGAFFEVSESIVEFNFEEVPPSSMPSTNSIAYGFEG